MDSHNAFSHKVPVSRGYSTQFEDHEDLIHKFARKAFGRLQSAHDNMMTYDDVFQEMSVAYIQAAKAWKPDYGVTFTAYLGRAIWNNFNHLADKLIERSVSVPILSIEEMEFRSRSDETIGGNCSFLEYLYADDDGVTESAETTVGAKEESLKNFESLSELSKQVIGELLSPSDDLKMAHTALLEHAQFAQSIGESIKPPPSQINFRFVIKHLAIQPSRATRVRDELKRVYGVQM